MKRRTISTLAALFLAIPLGASAITSEAQTNPSFSEDNTSIISQRGRKGRGQRWERMMEELDLTSAQREEIKDIREKYSSQDPDFKEEIKASRQKMQSLLASDASKSELRRQHQEMQNLRQKMGDRKFEAMLEMREVLTSEQRAKMAQLIKERSDSRGFHRFH
ncbi:MAG: Spy/CpxP family protein refolding chaperone [Xenococcaceae cyanobacterium MO_188.B19]|nr:Spy/CpxP family protein refolding chaperone [Xenococcaceae cyanobacterium MO_188.B19]